MVARIGMQRYGLECMAGESDHFPSWKRITSA
jgi:hypothetical protein